MTVNRNQRLKRL